MHRRIDAVRCLRQSPLFHDLSDEELADLSPPPEIVYLPAGAVLIRQGDSESDYYHLLSGRLRVFKLDETGRDVPVGHIDPGEGVGEMALLTGDPRSATVIARIESIVIRFRQAALLKLMERRPAAALHLARIVIHRLGRKAGPPAYERIAIIPLAAGVDSRTIAHSLSAELRQFRSSRAIDRQLRAPEWEPDELPGEYQVYDAGNDWNAWAEYCFRHADLILFAGVAGEPPPGNASSVWLSTRLDRTMLGRMDLLLLHPDEWRRDPKTSAWLAQVSPQEIHHLRRGNKGDMSRLARIIARRAVNLVLGGGGARGFAEFGVIRALREAAIPIDRVAGSSMGAFAGAILAFDGDFEALVAKTRETFRRIRPEAEFTLPLVSFLRGKRFQQVALEICGDWQIEDLPLRFFCLSAQLSEAEIVTHFDGPVWTALRSSCAMPVVGPPLLSGGQILVDGGALNNLPVDLMREHFSGIAVAVDVSIDQPMRMHPKWELACPSGFEILWNKINPFGERAEIPGIFEILYRTMILSTRARLRDTRERADWLIEPPVEGFGVTDFQCFDKLIEIGYSHTVKLLEEMKADRALVESRGLQHVF